MQITIKGMDELRAKLHAFPKELARAERNAVNVTATAVKNLGIDEAFNVYHVDKKSRLKKDSRDKNTTRIIRAKEGETSATVVFHGGTRPKDVDRIGLQHFKTDKQERNKKEKGWKPSSQIKRGGKIEKIERGFYAYGAGFAAKGRQRKARERGSGLWQRDPTRIMNFTDYKTRKRRQGDFIVRRTGPSLKMMVESSEVFKKVREKGHTILAQTMIKAVDAQLAKIKRQK